MTETSTNIALPPPVPGGYISVSNTPHSADIINTELEHRQWAVSVTEEKGLEVRLLESPDLRSNPHRVEGTRTVSDLPSFLAELDRRPLGAESTLWGNADRGKIAAVYNDHDFGVAGWRDDQLVLQLTPDPDWVKWHALSGRYHRQTEFGDLVEDLLHTVVAPDQAELLEIIDSIRATTRGAFENSIVRANGSQTVQFNTEVSTSAGRTGQLEVPQTVTLRLRPWEGHEVTYEVQAYFRLKIEGSALTLAIKLKPTRTILRNAWDDVTSKVTETIEKPVYAQP